MTKAGRRTFLEKTNDGGKKDEGAIRSHGQEGGEFVEKFSGWPSFVEISWEEGNRGGAIEKPRKGKKKGKSPELSHPSGEGEVKRERHLRSPQRRAPREGRGKSRLAKRSGASRKDGKGK